MLTISPDVGSPEPRCWCSCLPVLDFTYTDSHLVLGNLSLIITYILKKFNVKGPSDSILCTFAVS